MAINVGLHRMSKDNTYTETGIPENKQLGFPEECIKPHVNKTTKQTNL